MATGFYLKNKSRQITPINVIVSFKGQRYKRSSRISIESKHWNTESQVCREVKEYPPSRSINLRLKKIKKACDAVCDEMVESGRLLLSDEYWDAVDLIIAGTVARKIPPFTQYAKDYANNRERLGNRNTAKQYLTTYNKLTDYEKHYRQHLRFEDINLHFFNRFKQFIIVELGYSPNYFAALIKCIKVLYRDARELEGLHNFNETSKRGFSAAEKSPKTIYLSLQELEQIASIEFTPNVIIGAFPETVKLPAHKMQLKIDTYCVIRNKFLIGAYTGLRVSDYNRLTDINVDGNYIKITTKKTGAPVIVPIHPIVRRIIDSGFDLSTPISEQKINQHIKEIARCAGITKKEEGTKIVNGRSVAGYWDKCDMITSHTARRSAATNMYKAGIPALSIMRITGHQTERAFLKYIKISQEENAELMARNPYFAG